MAIRRWASWSITLAGISPWAVLHRLVVRPRPARFLGRRLDIPVGVFDPRLYFSTRTLAAELRAIHGAGHHRQLLAGGVLHREAISGLLGGGAPAGRHHPAARHFGVSAVGSGG